MRTLGTHLRLVRELEREQIAASPLAQIAVGLVGGALAISLLWLTGAAVERLVR